MADARNRADRAAGLLLIAAAGAALVLANSPLGPAWRRLVDYRSGLVLPQVGMLTPHVAVADGLMAIFFLLVGLEVKREWYRGRLSTPAERRLPILAAAAGMAVPALVYLLVTGFDPATRHGWAIPSATDIAFSMGLMALLGPRAAPSLKLLLVTIAVVDDIGAVIIIALGYTRTIDPLALGAAALVLGTMAGMSLFGVRRLVPYLVGFILLWAAMLASGVHATIAGVLTALTIPLGERGGPSPLRRLEHAINPWVLFGIVPLFGLVSAGVKLGGGVSWVDPLTLAVALGLVIGKQAGVFGAIRAAVALGIAPMPRGVGWRHVYGAALLCGIGFTMSLFIGALAFDDPLLADQARLGTIGGSLVCAIAGYLVLRLAPPLDCQAEDQAEADELFAFTLDKGEVDYRVIAPRAEGLEPAD